MEYINKAFLVLFVFIIVAVTGLITSYIPVQQAITGAATTATAPSQAVIQKFLAISASGNLSAGIDFGTILALPSYYVNATQNWNDTNSSRGYTNMSLYWIDVTDSNTNVDFCVRASDFNTSGGDEIGIENYTFSDSIWNNLTFPAPPPADWEHMMNITNWTVGDTDVQNGSSLYFRFWLNVTSGVAAGEYNNTITFKGVPNNQGCE